MRNLILKYSALGFAVSLCVISLVEWLLNGTYNFDPSKVIMYSIIFTICWTICMTIISVYNYRNSVEDESDDSTSGPKDAGVMYYYNDYKNGMCKVERIEYKSLKDLERKNYKTYFGFVNESGELVSKWYVGASDFYESGIAVVEIYDNDGNELFNIINKEGEELSVSWYYSICELSGGLFKVGWNDGTINFMNEKGELIWKEWKKELSIEKN